MKSKVLFIFTFCLLGSTIVSCIYGTCDPVPPHFEIKGLESYNMRFNNSGTNPWVTLQEDESVSWNNFFVRFEFEVNYIANKSLSFGGTLMALSCGEPGEAGDKIGVDTVIVRTVCDYNENYQAGSNINEIILTNRWVFFTDYFDEFIPLTDYLSNNSDGVRDNMFELKLTEPPTINTQFSFAVTYKLNNGEVFTHTIQTINLTK